MRRCPKCNAEITNDKAKYCKKCGTKLPPFEPQTNEENEDVTRLVHEGIPLTGKQEAPGSNTGGGMEVNPQLVLTQSQWFLRVRSLSQIA